MKTGKSSLRKEMLIRRNNYVHKELSDQFIFHKLIDICKDYTKIFTYINYRSEVDTSAFIKHELKQSKEIYAPICNTWNCTMIASRINNWASLQKNEFGIPEPQFSDASDIEFDAIIIPGSVFDITGNRIGYGKGYYDKFINSIDYEVKKIALCYDFQLLNVIPSEDHDVKMDIIITENRTVLL